MGGYDDNRHSGKDAARQGWLGTPTLPRVCTITFTSFPVLTRLCTRLAAVQAILVKLTEDRYWSNVTEIKRLNEEMEEKSSRNKDFIAELQSGYMRQGWQLEHLQADVRFLLERNCELTVECQDMMKTIHCMQETLVAALDRSPAKDQQLD
jgi:hypothetical protein